MSKIQDIISSLSELNHSELGKVLDEAKALYKAMRPVHIKEVYKKCGQENCTCRYGDVREYGHGPYLYAIYTDKDGSQKQRSLGRKLSNEKMEAICSKPAPKWFEYLVSDKQYSKMSRERQWEVYSRDLASDEFEEYYGISFTDDTMGRERSLRYDYKKHDIAFEKWSEMQEVCQSSFAYTYGIGTHKGYSKIKSLLGEGYYIT